MRDDTVLKVGDVVQLSPEHCANPMLAGCCMIVTEPKAFGAMGYIQAPGKDGEHGGQIYYRAGWAEMELVGIAYWVVGG